MKKRGAHFRNKGRADPGAWLQAIGMQQPLASDQLDGLKRLVRSAAGKH